MSERRQPPARRSPAPAHAAGEAPTISGEYRIIAPRSAGRELGDLELDDLGFLEDHLELECMPSSHGARAAAPLAILPPALGMNEAELRLGDAAAAPSPSPSPSPFARATSRSDESPVGPRAALVAFAGFGDPPTSLWGTPAYALRVIGRRRVLRATLVRARSLRSQDIRLYEAALQAADETAVRRGLVILGLMLVATAVVIGAQMITDRADLPW